ncbi:uncharacterized protein [Ptychodera flava]|uniref:uncharacterized protein n=1 Tax=Ptychodera flava TaxID=63121 RepID=UPI00396A9693
MASSNFPVPASMEMKGDLVQNWAFFRSNWENYEIATELNKKDQKIRVATLLSVMGKECFRIYKHLDMSEDDRTDEKKILDALEKHFEPTRNVIYERYVFNTCEQDVAESVDQYVTRLRQLATRCDFSTLTDEMVRDRIVLGTKDGAVRARMLREPKLNLNQAIEMCRSSEITQLQLKKIGTTEPETVHYATKYKPRTTKKAVASTAKRHVKQLPSEQQTKKQCRYCGTVHELKKDRCPAYGEVCRKCNKKNHFARVCKQQKANKRRTVYSVNQDDRGQSSSDESMMFVQHSVGTINTHGKQWFVTLNLAAKNKPTLTENLSPQ